MTDLAAVVRFVHVTAAVLLAGAFSFTLLIARPAFRRVADESRAEFAAFLHIQLRIARWCWLALVASALLGLWLQTAAVSESADFRGILTLLRETQYGNVWSARLILALILPLIFRFEAKRRGNDAGILTVVGFVLSAALLASLALAGHAAAAEGRALIAQVSVDALHLLAAGIWLGGLLPLALMLRECNRKSAAVTLAVAGAATQRFSTLAMVCVGTVMVTGAYNAWTLVGGFPPLFGTAYGRLLLLKLLLLLPLLVFAAVNRLRLKPKLVKASSNQNHSGVLRKLARNTALEASLGVGILLIVGYMGVTPPARHVQPDWPFSSRWDWNVLDQAPKARAEVQRGLVWAAIGSIALITVLARRRRRIVTAVIGLGALAYAGRVAVDAVSTDAYPTTYKRPAVAYQAISIANGKQLYEDTGCASCHGPAGYGDGPLAEELRPKPADLTAPHANTHTAGDLFWWVSHGVKNTSMPGFEQSVSEEERWDLINFMRALSTGDRARSLAPVIENEPWLVAPDFTYVTNAGEAKTLRDHRGARIVLLILLDVKATEQRLKELVGALPALRSGNVEVIVIPNLIDLQNVADRLPGLIVSEGIREISETYKLFARSFSDEGLVSGTRHVEFLIDKQGYIRARWLPAENEGWKKIEILLKQIDLLRKERPRAPAPDEHVH
jgi:putative copper export protein/mono/diheme cytochrome c family protein/peroxiredoxin